MNHRTSLRLFLSQGGYPYSRALTRLNKSADGRRTYKTGLTLRDQVGPAAPVKITQACVFPTAIPPADEFGFFGREGQKLSLPLFIPCSPRVLADLASNFVEPTHFFEALHARTLCAAGSLSKCANSLSVPDKRHSES